MTAALINPARQKQFQVLALPNLYGDILTDEAAQIQGGVGTAGSANIGKVYSMFEAIHGSAPRMVAEGRVQYADPSSIIRAGAMMLEYIGFPEQGGKLHKALDVCGQYEKKMVITGRSTGATSAQFGEYLMQTVEDPHLDAKWDTYVKAG
jgi:isocitrate dehydrogenase (NAD+)